MLKGNACHTSFVGVMAHAGFSGCKVTASNGVVYEIPVNGICQTKDSGRVKKSWLKRLMNLTIESAQWLSSRGAIVTVK